jgi:hypothetical protein
MDTWKWHNHEPVFPYKIKWTLSYPAGIKWITNTILQFLMKPKNGCCSWTESKVTLNKNTEIKCKNIVWKVSSTNKAENKAEKVFPLKLYSAGPPLSPQIEAEVTFESVIYISTWQGRKSIIQDQGFHNLNLKTDNSSSSSFPSEFSLHRLP